MKHYYLLLLSGIFFIQCEKEPDQHTVSKKDYLTQKPWKAKTIEVKKNNDPWQIQNGSWPACMNDNEWIFLTSGKMQVTEGPTKCFPGDPQTISESDWTLSIDETKVTVTSGATVNDWVIEKLTADEFISTSSANVSGDILYVKRYMIH